MKVYLPKELDRGPSMYWLINQVLDANNNPKSNVFDFDFTTLKFIRPVGVTVLSNLVGRLHRHGASVTFTYNLPNRSQKHCPMAFLDDSMFFKYYLKQNLDSFASLRPTTRPLENVTYDASYAYLDQTMAWLAVKLNLTKESLGDLKTCLKEVFNNIRDHSSENIGSIFVQQYPSQNRVMVAISDFGVGIPNSIQSHEGYRGVDDAEALRLSVQEGFTTKSTPRNRGAGLDFLLHNVVKNNQGSVYIHSNHGILSSTYVNNGIHTVVEKTGGFYPGTLLEIEFRTDTIQYIEEEFSWE